MSSQQIHAVVGEVLPGCEIPLRPDGTCTQAVQILDPIRMHLVLGVDVSPYHEHDIIQACKPEAPGRGWQRVDPHDGRRLWQWLVVPGCPDAVLLILRLRRGQRQWPRIVWGIRYPAAELCDECAVHLEQAAQQSADLLQQCPSKGLPAQIILVGREHRVLGLSMLACHNTVGMHWLRTLAQGCHNSLHPEDPEQQQAPDHIVHAIAGLPECMRPEASHAWLVSHGWVESVQEARLRRRRQRARRRQMP
jgi:hypothetical protein